jgi:hypothetical protein
VIGERRADHLDPLLHAGREVRGEEGAGAGVERHRVADLAVQEREEVVLELPDRPGRAGDGDVEVALRGKRAQFVGLGVGRPDLVRVRQVDRRWSAVERKLSHANSRSR